MILYIEDYSISPKVLQGVGEVERFQGFWQHTTAKYSPHFVGTSTPKTEKSYSH